MRKILFRGKHLNNGEWEYGYYCFLGPAGKEKHFIIPTSASAFYGIEIDPFTLGQYTGMTDKNGKRIFEGDVLRYINEDKEPRYILVVFEKCAFLIEDGGVKDTDLLTSYVCLGLEVVGSVYDD